MIAYQLNKAKQYGVSLQLGQRVDASTVMATAPEAVVLATGATLRPPPSLAANADSITAADAYVVRLAPVVRQKRVLFFDMDHSVSAYAVVDLLAQQVDHVVLVTPRTHIAQNVNYCSAIGVHRRLHQARVEIVTGHDLINFQRGTVTVRNVFTDQESEFTAIDEVIYATPRLVIDPLGSKLSSHVELQRVGDCQSPRHLMAAIQGGHFAGLAF